MQTTQPERWVKQIKVSNSSLIKVPLWVLLLLVSFVLFPIKGLHTGPDASFYLVWGTNIHHGLGYLSADWSHVTNRGPVFPALIALFFWLFGISTQSAMGVVRLFFVLNVMLIYVIGAKFFNRAVGFIASGLILTSLTIHQWSSSILLDNIWPFFALLSHLLVYMAFETKRLFYFSLAGLVLGIAFLTKDVAGLFLPLPALLWFLVPAYRSKNLWRGILLFWSMALILIISWFVYVYSIDSNSIANFQRTVFFVLGESSQIAADNEVGQSSLSVPIFLIRVWFDKLWLWLSNYYQQYIADQFALAPLFLLAWVYLLFKTVRKCSGAKVLLIISFLLFSPIIFFLGRSGWRVGQSFYLYLLFYLVLAFLLYGVGDYFPLPKYRSVAKLGIVVIAIGIQFGAKETGFIRLLKDATNTGFIPSMNIYSFSFGKNGWEEQGWHRKVIQEAGEWLEKHTTANENIVSDEWWADSIYFYLDARQPIFTLPRIVSNKSDLSEQQAVSPILFVWTQAGRVDPDSFYSYLNAYSEPQILNYIRQVDASYVVVTQRQNFLALYFEASPSFEKVQQFEEGQIQIFRVRKPLLPIAADVPSDGQATPFLHQVSENSFTTHVTPQAVKYLDILRTRSLEEYRILKSNFLQRALNLTDKEIEQLELGQYPSIEVNQIIGTNNYINMVRRNGLEGLQKAIALQEQKAKRDSNNPWPCITLGELYLAQADMTNDQKIYQKSKASYHEAFFRASDNIEALGVLLQVFVTLGEPERLSITSAIYKQVIELEPDNIQAYWKLANIYEITDQGDKAIAIYADIASRWPDLTEAQLRLGQAYEAQGKIEAALSKYEQAVMLEPTLDTAYLRLGKLYQARNQPDKSIIWYQAAAQKNREAAWPHLELGKLYLEQASTP